ncbi:MAG TPA: deoxyribonuclease IV [Gemmatimonadaceae bacterium]|nr:deoxyribonuclease IV [Gemmatimonadaceae bacterium]
MPTKARGSRKKRTPPSKVPAAPLGAHISIAGGTHNAPPRAATIGATAMQIFTKMANRWAERACDDGECSQFHLAVGLTEVREMSAHDSYLINLASPDPILRTRSFESFACELRRCKSLGLDYLVSHPGNFMDERASGVARNAESLGAALELVDGETVVLMETTAGSGTAIGASFEEMAQLIELVPSSVRHRVGVCIDTCHIFAAGYDIVSDYDGVMQRFGDIIGFERLRMMHLNDSKAPLGSRRDRHELIAEGAIGEAAFRRIMNDSRLSRVAKVIETPKTVPDVTDREMLERLRGYIE